MSYFMLGEASPIARRSWLFWAVSKTTSDSQLDRYGMRAIFVHDHWAVGRSPAIDTSTGHSDSDLQYSPHGLTGVER